MSEDVKVEKDEADRIQFDGLAVTGRDPAFHYRWARQKDINVARHKWKGYEVVDSTTDKSRSVLNDNTKMKKGADATTMVEVADMVLMRIPKEKYERILAEREDKIRRQTRGVSGTFKHEVNRISRAAGQGDAAYEEHKDNPNMRGMSEKAFDKFIDEQRHEQQRR